MEKKINVEKEISLNNILNFQKRYEQNQENKKIEEEIRQYGILKASIDNKKLETIEFKFNIEVPESKIANQLDSHQCDVYAFLRVIKDIICQNNLIDRNELDLSSSYLSFYDKLEKANTLYNKLIEKQNVTIEEINNNVNHYIGSYGTFHFCRELVNKYGLVPKKVMKDLNSKFKNALTIELLQKKIKSDALSLINLSKEEKRTKKEELMYETYQFLSRIYGTPPLTFDYKGEKITPLEFKNQYVKTDLNEYITVTTFNKEKFYNSYSYIPSIYLNNVENIVHLSPDKVKKAIIKQLQDNISVWFSSEESTTLDYDINILDNKIYNFNSLLNIKEISKNNQLSLDIINYDHAMCITGALVENNKIKQWKVENSFGKHGVFNGKLIMTDSFFDNCVLTTIINKKYLDSQK